MRRAASLTAAQRGIKGESLDPENHSKKAWWKTRRNRSREGNEGFGTSRAEFGNLCGGDVARKSASGTHGCGYAQRSLSKTAAVLILAGLTAGSELEQIRILGFANPRTAGMARGHGVVVSGLLLSHFTPRMRVPDMHDEHRRHSHLCPGHYGYKQRCRNEPLHHKL